MVFSASSTSRPHLPMPPALLLLPPPPSPSSFAALQAAYHPPLFTVLKELATSPRTAQDAVLEIALPCPHLHGRLHAPRGPLFATTQQLVAGLYKLVATTASTEAIDTDEAEGVDARVILLAYPRDGQMTASPPDAMPEQEMHGPAIDLHTLARSPRPWDRVYSVASEAGERILQGFLARSEKQPSVSRVRGGIVSISQAGEEAGTGEAPSGAVQHLAVAVGGTFDHLHIGHKLLLTMFAFVLGRPSSLHLDSRSSVLTVGITGDALLVKKKYAEHLQSWRRRQEAVHDFLSSLVYFGPPEDERIQVHEVGDAAPNGHAVHISFPCGLTIRYVEIGDPFGPTITDPDITALVLSLETRGGGAAVNSKRGEQGWEPLEVFEVAVLDASGEDSVDETFQSKLSSTEIRRKQSERSRARWKQ